MNHINWVQQNEDYKVKYHVLKWKTSHFHEPYSNHMVGTAKIRQGGAAEVPAAERQEAEGEGLGAGLAERGRDARLRLGLGLEESLANNLSGGENGRDGVSISARGMAGQESLGGTTQAAMQSLAMAETHAAENTVTAVMTDGPEKEKQEQEQERAEKENTTVAESGRGNIRNRLRESAARLREAYQRQKKKAAKLPLRQIRKEETAKKEKKGTRQAADRETMLSMQAENHYLLDSYDAKGNYSMLGKK